MFRQFALAAPLLALIVLPGCHKKAEPLNVIDGYVRLNANPDNPAAAYFTIQGGPEDVVLRHVDTDAALKIEMHDTVTKNGVMSMKPIDTVNIPAHKVVKFEPGGKHIMVWQINPQAIAAGSIRFKFTFSNGETIVDDAVIEDANGKRVGAGLPPPTAGADNVTTTIVK